MQQREITDKNGTRWTCVQAFSGANGSKAAKATELSETENNKVPVVCTPSGGAQTVRINLDKGWIDRMEDGELLKKIKNGSA